MILYILHILMWMLDVHFIWLEIEKFSQYNLV